MSKELPYFKFEPNQWENGNIQFFNRDLKGLFIDLCSMYWSRLGDLDYALALQKLCNGITQDLELLMQRDVFIIEEDKIIIEFLDEQLNEFQETNKKRREAANKRWGNANALQEQSKSNAIRGEKRREEKRRRDNINKTLLSEIKISDLEEEEIDFFKIAISFQKLFIKNLQEKKAPILSQKNASFKNYVDPIRLMMQNDEVTKPQIQKVYKYLSSPEGEFWKANILSTKKLREKFSQLILKSNEKLNGTKLTTTEDDNR